MKCLPKKKMVRDRLNDAYHNVGSAMLSFLDVSTGCVIREYTGHAKKRLQDMFNGTKDQIDGMFDFYGADGDDTRERAETSLHAMIRTLRFCGFDFVSETKKLPFDDPFSKTWHPQEERSKHENRLNFVNAMELLAQTYHITILTYFREKHHYGAERLSALYKLLRSDYNSMLTEYLRCTSAGDAKVQSMISERQKKIEELGLTLVEV